MSTATEYLDEPAVSLNGLQFGPGTPYAVVEFNPFRLRARANSQPRAWNHGAWSGAEWAEEVIVPLVLTVRPERDEPDCLVTPEAEDAWAALQQALSAAWAPIGDLVGESELRFTLGSRDYVMFGRPRVVDPDTRNLWRIARTNTQLVFAALDPRKYSADQVTESTGLSQQEGGLTVPGFIPPGSSSPPFGLVMGTDNASTPDTAELDVSNELRFGVDLVLDNWSPGTSAYLLTKYDFSSDQRSYALRISSTNDLEILISSNGTGFATAVSIPVPVANGTRLAVQGTVSVDPSTGDYTALMETAASRGGTWTEVGSGSGTLGSTTLFDGTAPLVVGAAGDGSSPAGPGTVFSAWVEDDGVTVAHPRFDIQPDGTTGFTDSAGRIWTASGTAQVNGATAYRSGLTVPFVVGGFLVGGLLDLVNEGTAPAPLFMRIDGPVVNPRVILQRPDGSVQEIDFFDLTVAAGQWIEINTASGTALLNGLPGSSVRGRVIWDIDPYPLLPGTTTLRFTAEEFNEDALLTVVYRSAWW